LPDFLRDQLQTSLGAAYTLERELGGGGMSRVFVAREEALGRDVVVKVLPPETAASVSIERFKREIQLAARLQHPHIVPLLTAGESEGLPYFTMPFVEGESLRARLARRGELPVAEAVRVLREIASALAYAHEHGVVHRDIKPDNVLLSGGAAMVTDFGVARAISASSNAEHARITSLGVALGTPAYMSPEQASADPAVDHRADVYAFGVLAYELLTGQTPFGGRTPQGLLAAHVTEPPEPVLRRRPSLPPGLAALVMRCLEKRPADRPQTAAEVVHALDDVTPPSGTSSRATIPATTTEANVRRRWLRALVPVAGAVAGVVLSVLAGAYVTSKVRRAPAAAVPQSIAVLPLENLGGDTATQFFADGMTDEITSTVAKLAGLRTASRSATAAAVRASAGDVRALGERLKVGAVLEGRIRRSGGRMRLTTELTGVKDGRILWTESYDREVKDAFAVQDEVARAIAGALRVTLAGGSPASASRRTTSPEAHDLYLRGRYLQNKYTEPDLRTSIALFEQALARDPRYAMAWSGIADSWMHLADDYVAPRAAVPRVREAIARGMAIDSTLPELQFSRALLAYIYDRDLHEARRLMAGSVRAAPVELLWYYPLLLWTLGARDSAAAVWREAVARDPASPELLLAAWRYHRTFGDAAEARRYCVRLEELRAGEPCHARDALLAGRPDSAIARARRRMRGDGDSRSRSQGRLILVEVLVASGRVAEARAEVVKAEAEAKASTRYVREDWIASMWSMVGDDDRAMQWYERAYASGVGGIGVLYSDLAELPLRHDPRALALAKRAGLPDPPPYWHEPPLVAAPRR
jgi:eukaryotic-like serine/threonine-protein kinase